MRDDASIVLAAVGVLGMSLMFGGLHLLSMDMKKGADRMSTQLLNMADLFIFGTFGLFLAGFGAQTAVILLTNDTTAVYEDRATRGSRGIDGVQCWKWALGPHACVMGACDDQHGTCSRGSEGTRGIVGRSVLHADASRLR